MKGTVRKLGVVKSTPKPGAGFGKYIKTERLKRKLSQRELGQRADISKAYVSMLERSYGANIHGEPTRPSITVVEKLARALAVPVERIRHEAGYSLPPGPTPVTLASSEIDGSSVGILFYEFNQKAPHQRKALEEKIGPLIEFAREIIRKEFS